MKSQVFKSMTSTESTNVICKISVLKTFQCKDCKFHVVCQIYVSDTFESQKYFQIKNQNKFNQ